MINIENYNTRKLNYGNYTYVFDNNHIEIREGDLLISKCYYKYSKLIREDNLLLNKTFVYEYDLKGNIIRKTEQDLSFCDNLNNVFVSEFKYSELTQKLISYNGENFKYDINDCATIYRNARFAWKNRNLTAVEDFIRYEYDNAGTRISKTVNSNTTKFYNVENKILFQKGDNSLYFLYDDKGVKGFTLLTSNIQSFKYEKNIFGDIVGIYNSDNVLFCKYLYDSTGNCYCFVLDNNGKYINIAKKYNPDTINPSYIFIAELNPFRFRGYYLDFETGFYYHNGNYYDPELGVNLKSINADNNYNDIYKLKKRC